MRRIVPTIYVLSALVLLTILALAGCTAIPRAHLVGSSAQRSTDSQAAEEGEGGRQSEEQTTDDNKGPKGIGCVQTQMKVARHAVTSACAFDKGAAAEWRALREAEDRIDHDYNVVLSSQLDDPRMKAYIAEICAASQPERAARADALLDQYHVALYDAYDGAHPMNLGQHPGYILTAECGDALKSQGEHTRQ